MSRGARRTGVAEQRANVPGSTLRLKVNGEPAHSQDFLSGSWPAGRRARAHLDGLVRTHARLRNRDKSARDERALARARGHAATLEIPRVPESSGPLLPSRRLFSARLCCRRCYLSEEDSFSLFAFFFSRVEEASGSRFLRGTLAGQEFEFGVVPRGPKGKGCWTQLLRGIFNAFKGFRL